MDKRLLIFSIFYTLITIGFFTNIQQDQSASLGYIYIFPAFWILAGIAIVLIIWLGQIKIKKWNIAGLLFSSPLPTWIFISIWISLPVHQPCSTYEHNVGGRRLREITYQQYNFKNERKEYWSCLDSISEQNPFPNSENYRLDSIIYFDDSHIIVKREAYKNGHLIK